MTVKVKVEKYLDEAPTATSPRAVDRVHERFVPFL